MWEYIKNNNPDIESICPSTSVDTGELPAEIDECWQPVHPVLLGIPRVIHLGQYVNNISASSCVQAICLIFTLTNEMSRESVPPLPWQMWCPEHLSRLYHDKCDIQTISLIFTLTNEMSRESVSPLPWQMWCSGHLSHLYLTKCDVQGICLVFTLNKCGFQGICLVFTLTNEMSREYVSS